LKKNIAPIDSLINIALKNNPNLKKTFYDEKSASYSTSMAYGNLYPRISGSITYSRRVPEFDILYSDYNREYTFQYGISLSINVFKGFQDYVNIQKSKLNEKYYKENHIETKRNLESTIRQLNDTFLAYLNIININTQNLEAAKEEYRLAEERYRIGSGTALEVREAQVNLTRAEQTLVAAQYNARIVQAQIEENLGSIYKQ
jgi:outer membrane protein TolC